LRPGDKLGFIDGDDVRTIEPGLLTQMMDEVCSHSRRLTVFRDQG
jgi:hypothetical protein